MIIADIIKELETVSPADLKRAIQGLRTVYCVFPAKLKKQMLGEYSDTEYALLSALRSHGQVEWGVLPPAETKKETIYDIYNNTKE